MKIGQRVEHETLGQGTVVELTPHDWLVMVEYDQRPPKEYNMGQNPTAELVKMLTAVTHGQPSEGQQE